MTWSPTRILEFDGPPAMTSTRPFRVRTDAGDAIVKSLGNPEGPHALAREWIGTHAARVVGLPTFDLFIVEIDEAGAAMARSAGATHVVAGPAIVVRYEDGAEWDGSARILREARNVTDVGRMIVLDSWIRNHDRYLSHPGEGSWYKPDNVWVNAEGDELELKAIDHTHCFRGRELIPSQLTGIGREKEPIVYGRFPAFDGLIVGEAVDDALARAHRGRGEMARCLDNLPAAWEVSADAVNAILGFLSARAVFLLDFLPTELAVRPGQLPLEDDR